MALATGTRKVRLTMGDKSIEYSNTQIDELKQLRADIMAELPAAGSTRGSFFLASTSKGL
jgi:N-acetyl-anhydromuramyl-L-alanine amidase AmpD